MKIPPLGELLSAIVIEDWEAQADAMYDNSDYEYESQSDDDDDDDDHDDNELQVLQEEEAEHQNYDSIRIDTDDDDDGQEKEEEGEVETEVDIQQIPPESRSLVLKIKRAGSSDIVPDKGLKNPFRINSTNYSSILDFEACCCGCGGDVSGSTHMCTSSHKKVFGFCLFEESSGDGICQTCHAKSKLFKN
jgi:hypothetical protein